MKKVWIFLLLVSSLCAAEPALFAQKWVQQLNRAVATRDVSVLKRLGKCFRNSSTAPASVSGALYKKSLTPVQEKGTSPYTVYIPEDYTSPYPKLKQLFLTDPTTIEKRYLYDIPRKLVTRRLHLTIPQNNQLKAAYRYLLEEYQANAKGHRALSEQQWKNVITLSANIGLLGTQEDAPFILKIIEKVPREYLEVTDYIAIRTLLLLEAYPQLEALAAMRQAQAHSWAGMSTPELHTLHMDIFDQLKAYAQTHNLPIRLPWEMVPGEIMSSMWTVPGAELLEENPVTSLFLHTPEEDLTPLQDMRNQFYLVMEP